MDRLKWLALGLMIAHGVIYVGSSRYALPRTTDVQIRVDEIERDLPGRRAIDAWMRRVGPAAKAPSEENPAEVLLRLQSVATPRQFQVTHTDQRPGDPPVLVFAGHGPFAAAAAAIDDVGSREGLRLDRLALTVRDDDRLETRLEVSCHRGPWEGATLDGQPESATPSRVVLLLGSPDPFGVTREAPAAPVVAAPRPVIRYLGFYASKTGVTAILEDGGKAALVSVGAKLPGGNRLEAATATGVEIIDGRGNRWVYPMQRTP